jgi:hypothetical protein
MDTCEWIAEIRNAAWHVRQIRMVNRPRRQQAILRLGVTVRAALAESEDYESILGAIVEGLRPLEQSGLGK